MVLLVLVACSHGSPDPATPDASSSLVDAAADGPVTQSCVDIDDGATVQLATAVGAGDYALSFAAASASETSWGDAGNEALILEVSGAHGLIGHVILHQGATQFTYAIHTGALDVGEMVGVKVSTLSAANATRKATILFAGVGGGG
ncbi:MAG: hypothetical protein QM831_45330 [Kofleriaceae bacterium]